MHKIFKFFLIPIFAILPVLNSSVWAASSEEDERFFPEPGRPMLIKDLREKSIVFLDETIAPDNKEADAIAAFKDKIVRYTKEGKLFSIDLSHTYIGDDAIRNLVGILSQPIADKRGVRPKQYVSRINLSCSRCSEEGLLALKDLLEQDNLKYVDITVSHASDRDSMSKLYGALSRKYGYRTDDEGGFTLDEEGQDKVFADYYKIIWLPASFFRGRYPSAIISPTSAALHKKYYKIAE